MVVNNDVLLFNKAIYMQNNCSRRPKMLS